MDGVLQIILKEIGQEVLQTAVEKMVEAGMEQNKKQQLYKDLKQLPRRKSMVSFIVDENSVITMTKD